jgi:choline kinase
VTPRAIILAAGRGSRLTGASAGRPKCLLRLGGVTLLERQLAALHLAGIRRITVVTGYQAPSVAAVCHGLADTVENTRFAETNSLYSLWLARPLLGEGFVVLNGDVLFHSQLLSDLVSCHHDDALLVSYRGNEPLGDEEMKVKVRRGCVVDIAKTLPVEEADGENVGIARFSPDGARLLVSLMDELVSAGRLREWAPRAFRAFAAKRPLHAVGTRGFPWIEIDFPEDYRRASREVLPQVDDRVEVASDDVVEVHTPAVPELTTGQGPADWRPQSGHV